MHETTSVGGMLLYSGGPFRESFNNCLSFHNLPHDSIPCFVQHQNHGIHHTYIEDNFSMDVASSMSRWTWPLTERGS